MRVYLAGTITRDPKHLGWREELAARFERLGHTALSPMRGKDAKDLDALGLTSAVPTSLFVERDLQDIATCDVIFMAYHKDCPRQSVGTWAELGIATTLGKPVILWTDDPVVAAHPFVKQLTAYCTDSMELAFKAVLWMDGRGQIAL